MATFFVSPALLVGDQEWRVVVRDHPLIAGERAVDYEFRTFGAAEWRSQSLWPASEPPDAAKALYRRHSLALTVELDPDRNPALPGV